MALYADISKAKELLAWEPEIDLAEGIAKTISFYKKSHG
jgi:nucleoside-diphosphate-sugar epimerase